MTAGPIGFAVGLWRVFDPASHFRMRYPVLAALFLIGCVRAGRWRAALVVGAAILAPFAGSPSGPEAPGRTRSIHHADRDFAAFRELADRESLDPIAPGESTPAWEEFVDDHLAVRPCAITAPGGTSPVSRCSPGIRWRNCASSDPRERPCRIRRCKCDSRAGVFA